MDKEDSKRFSKLRKLSFLKASGILLLVTGTPYSIFVWRGRVYWDNKETEETVTFECAFEDLPVEIQTEILFNLDLFF